jgi:hypothetical protein
MFNPTIYINYQIIDKMIIDFLPKKKHTYIAMNLMDSFSWGSFFRLKGKILDIQIQLMEILYKTINVVKYKSDKYYVSIITDGLKLYNNSI